MAKYRGYIRFTKEKLRKVIGLPEEVEIGHMEYDVERELCSFILHSDDVVGRLTFLTGEGQEIIQTSIQSEDYVRAYLERAIETINGLPQEERNDVLERLFERENEDA